jgi:hypothetical protein
MRIFYIIYAVLIIGVLSLSHGDSLAMNAMLWAMIALWCAALVAVSLKLQWAHAVALAAFAPLISVLLFQTGRRVVFIVQNGGMDRASGEGSPVAFLLGWMGEASLLLPGIFLCLWLARGKRHAIRRN